MGMMEGLNKSNSLIHFGNRGDVCHLCLKEKCIEEKTDTGNMRIKMKGEFEGKKVIKIRHSGADVIICLDHIHKIAEENPKEEK